MSFSQPSTLESRRNSTDNPLKQDLQSELELARVFRRSDATEGAAGQSEPRTRRGPEVCAVEGVEELGPELEPQVFLDRRGLEQGQVIDLLSRGTEDVRSEVAK